MTAWALHLGFMSSIRKHKRRLRIITDLEKHITQLEDTIKHAVVNKYPKGAFSLLYCV